MNKSNQQIKNVRSHGAVEQSSDVQDTQQRIIDTNAAGDVKQKIKSQPPTLSVGGSRARGTIAVLALVIIVGLYFFFRWYFQK